MGWGEGKGFNEVFFKSWISEKARWVGCMAWKHGLKLFCVAIKMLDF